jgi:hypothetical protein
MVLTRGAKTLSLILIAACGTAAAFATPASAWPGNEKDLCTRAGTVREVTVQDPKVQTNPRGVTEVGTVRACSPPLRLPGLGTASPTEMYKEVQPKHVLEGGLRSPAITRDRLVDFTFVKGPEGSAVRYVTLTGSDILLNAIAGAGIEGGTVVVVGVISCLAGGWATGGIACLGIPAAAATAITGAIGGVIGAVIDNHLDRVVTMAASDWDFHPGQDFKGWIVWNGFGTIGHNFVDPSFSNLWPGESPDFRMWSWFSRYVVEQGPNPDYPNGNQAGPTRKIPPLTLNDIDPDDLNVRNSEIDPTGPDDIRVAEGNGNHALDGRRGDDVLVGARGDDRLRGAAGNDILSGAAGNDHLLGGPGPDVLFGGRGRDVVRGGPGNDQLSGEQGRDRLAGGPGSDTLYDFSGPTIAYGGPGNDRFSFLDKRGDDVIHCGPGRRDIVIMDAGDRADRSCEYVFPDGRGAPRSPARVGR